MTKAIGRIAKGCCPKCGKEAAPYLLCNECRYTEKIRRMLDRGVLHGGLRKERRGRHAYYIAQDAAAFARVPWRGNPKPGDKRLEPRLGGRIVEVDEELLRLIQSFGRPVSVDEIIVAWGHLREERKHGSLAADLAAIIRATDKRERRRAKLIALERQS